MPITSCLSRSSVLAITLWCCYQLSQSRKRQNNSEAQRQRLLSVIKKKKKTKTKHKDRDYQDNSLFIFLLSSIEYVYINERNGKKTMTDKKKTQIRKYSTKRRRGIRNFIQCIIFAAIIKRISIFIEKDISLFIFNIKFAHRSIILNWFQFSFEASNSPKF